MSFVTALTTSSKRRDAPCEQADDSARDGPTDHATGNAATAAPNRADRGLALIAASRASPDRRRHTAAAWAVEVACLEPFAVDVHRRGDLAIVQPRGELDLATVETLRAALDAIEGAGRLVLDLRGLSFLDCAGLHLLVALHVLEIVGDIPIELRDQTAPALG